MEMVECSLVAARGPRRMTPPAVLGVGRARLRVRSERLEQPPQVIRASAPTERDGRALGTAAAGLAAAAVVSLTGFAGDIIAPPPAQAESLTVAFPVSKAREVNRVQRTLVEAWGLIRETFVDPTFNHQDWDQKLQQTMVEMFPLKSADAAYGKISGMVSTLGDPFTKIISPKEYQSFRIGSDGNLQGVGIFINTEPGSGRLLVMNCVQGGPADRAGIREGDELVEIDGNSVLGLDGEAVAQRLRGRAGTTVEVKLLDGNGNEKSGKIKQKEVQLSREVINLSPLSTAIISHRTDDGLEGKTGYVRLAAFSQTAAAEMESAVKKMEDEGVQSYILDLRNNPGGLVKAGLDVAQIWLDGDETLVNTVDREGNVRAINMVHPAITPAGPTADKAQDGPVAVQDALLFGPASAATTLMVDLCRSPAASLLGPRPSVSAPTRRKRNAIPLDFTPRRSGRIRMQGDGTHKDPVTKAQAVLIKRLGLTRGEETISIEAQDEYFGLFKDQMAPQHLRAFAALFDPDGIAFDEPAQDGFAAFSLPSELDPCGA